MHFQSGKEDPMSCFSTDTVTCSKYATLINHNTIPQLKAGLLNNSFVFLTQHLILMLIPALLTL